MSLYTNQAYVSHVGHVPACTQLVRLLEVLGPIIQQLFIDFLQGKEQAGGRERGGDEVRGRESREREGDEGEGGRQRRERKEKKGSLRSGKTQSANRYG